MSLNPGQKIILNNKFDEASKFRIRNNQISINLLNAPISQNQLLILSDGSTMSSSSAASINQQHNTNNSYSKINDHQFSARPQYNNEQFSAVLPTEEDFKQMEFAVKNLLTSKKQIEALKNERNSLIQVYETKLNEQNDQIRYLQDENIKLKSSINALKSRVKNVALGESRGVGDREAAAFVVDASAKDLRTKNASPTEVPLEVESVQHDNWRHKYELFLDNIMRQILNALKIQETIRIEFTNLNQQQKQQQTTTTNNDLTNKTFICQSCKTKKINVESKRVSKTNLTPNSETMARFQDLLNKQQQQQLNLLTELSKISDSLKNKCTNTHRLPHSKSFNNQSTQTKPNCKHQMNNSKNNSEFNLKQLIISEPDETNSSFLNESNLECLNSSVAFGNEPSERLDFLKTSFENDSLDINDKMDDELINVNEYSFDLHAKSCSENRSDKHNCLSSEGDKMKVRESSPSPFCTRPLPKTSSEHNFETKPNTQSNFMNKSLNETKAKEILLQSPNSEPSHFVKPSKIPKYTNRATCAPKNADPNMKVLNKTEPLGNSSKIPLRLTKKRPKDEEEALKSNESKSAKQSKPINATKPVVKTSRKKPAQQIKTKADPKKPINSTTFDKLTNELKPVAKKANIANKPNVDKPKRKLKMSQNEANAKSLKVENKKKLKSSTLTRSQSDLIKKCDISNKSKCKKRFCFPKLRPLSYYFKSKYFTSAHYQKHKKKADLNCKYLSESDITSLNNQLDTEDRKDLAHNVFHLDTLYNNIDYILFNSYASDSELVYDFNIRNGPNKELINSNYQLFINDYFNHEYDREYDTDCDADFNASESDLEKIKEDATYLLVNNNVSRDVTFKLSEVDEKKSIVEDSVCCFNEMLYYDDEDVEIFGKKVSTSKIDLDEKRIEDYLDILYGEKNKNNDEYSDMEAEEEEEEDDDEKMSQYSQKLYNSNSPIFSFQTLSSLSSKSCFLKYSSFSTSTSSSLENNDDEYKIKKKQKNKAESKRKHCAKSYTIHSSIILNDFIDEQKRNLIKSLIELPMLEIIKNEQENLPSENETFFNNSVIPLISLTNKEASKILDKASANTNAASQTAKINDFNNDFYKLCSDTFYNGSDFNINNSITS